MFLTATLKSLPGLKIWVKCNEISGVQFAKTKLLWFFLIFLRKLNHHDIAKLQIESRKNLKFYIEKISKRPTILQNLLKYCKKY